MIANSPVPMPKPPTAKANSAHPLETVPTVSTSGIEFIDATHMTSGSLPCGYGIARPFPRFAGQFHLRRALDDVTPRLFRLIVEVFDIYPEAKSRTELSCD